MASNLSDKDWEILVSRVESQKCTPFLGAGASAEVLPVGADLSRELALEHKYPSADVDDLVRVSQFIALQSYDAMVPKEKVLKRISGASLPPSADRREPHAFFAHLPIAIYVTTNYDDLLTQALKRTHRKPRQEVCRWNASLKGLPSHFDPGHSYVPDVANPLIYHLHGHGTPESLVLTEDDYLEFLVNMVRGSAQLPDRVKEALSQPSLLFIGYGLRDWNLRVLLNCLRPERSTLSIVVLKLPGKGGAAQAKIRKYLEQYYGALHMRVYWGTARKFCAEFLTRLNAAGVQLWGGAP